MTKILFIGCGKMGGALLSGMLTHYAKEDFVTITPHDYQDIQKKYGVKAVASAEEITDWQFDVAILAVKPQTLPDILPQYQSLLPKTTLLISIAAGKTCSFFKHYFLDTHIIRAMPNLPATIGQGVTALCAADDLKENQRKLAETVFSGAGEVVWLEDEARMDAFTAIAGSGPAYVFHFIEAFTAAAEALGIAESVALKTFFGSVALANQSEQSAAALRQAVTSPKGTTEAGLEVLMQEDVLTKLLIETAKAAKSRSEELQ